MRMRTLLPAFFVLLVAAPGYGQDEESCTFKGRVLAPGYHFNEYVEVVMMKDYRVVGWGYTNSTGEFSLPPQPGGEYIIVVRIEGFEEYRERLFANACPIEIPVFPFMEFEKIPIVPVVLDFTGEVKEVVDIAELRRQFPKKVIDEFEQAQRDRIQDNPARARQRLERIVREAPDFYDARNVLGTVYLELKMFREAEAEYNEARELRPASAAPLVSLGSLYVQEADAAQNPQQDAVGVVVSASELTIILTDARDVLGEAIKLKPDAAFAHYLYGIVHYKAGQFAQAETSFRQALTLEPKLRWSRLALANMYMRLSRWKEAVAELDTYLVDFPKMQNRTEVEAARDSAVKRIATR
jgi:thioredoxin-like negative regulator of GroEL